MNMEIVTIDELKKLDISFDDVVGLQNLKEKAAFIIKAKSAAPSQKIKVPKGIIFAGKPGCGKTFFGKILAKQLEYNFIYLSAATLQSPVPGIGKSKVIKMFRQARSMKPCVLFLDEIDAVIKDREKSDDADSGGILQQFLTELDGSADNSNMLVIIATNVLEQLDAAFVRSGRFDIKFYFDVPVRRERAEVLYNILEGKLLGVDLGVISEITEGMSYADLGALCKLAGEYAFMENSPNLTNAMLIRAAKVIAAGESSNKASMSAPSKRMFCSHVGAHTLAYALLGPDFMTFSQVSSGTKLICMPSHRAAKVHRCSDHIVKLASIITVKLAETKQGAATNLYDSYDHPLIEDLLDKIVNMVASIPVSDPALINLLKQKIVSTITSYMSLLYDKHKDLLEQIVQKLTVAEYVTRKDLVELSSNTGVRKTDCKLYREHLESTLKQVLEAEINKYNEANGTALKITLPSSVVDKEEEEELLTEEDDFSKKGKNNASSSEAS